MPNPEAQISTEIVVPEEAALEEPSAIPQDQLAVPLPEQNQQLIAPATIEEEQEIAASVKIGEEQEIAA